MINDSETGVKSQIKQLNPSEGRVTVKFSHENIRESSSIKFECSINIFIFGEDRVCSLAISNRTL